ncbi:hypothetical protein GGR55DRAFT_659774 [Xylaria sp. FL0064]|nr:hypothetical protein GGR55DRAFT_659774 [Xylaria sp. FL0064]
MAVSFGTEIYKANVSNEFSIQYDWAVNHAACLRPTTEYDITIVCEVYKLDAPRLPSLGIEYDAFAKCCNRTDQNRNATQWIVIDPCETEYCFTNDQALAANFDQCISNTATEEAKKLKSNVTGINYRGRCEWIDYDEIKKGVREDPADLSSAAGFVLPWVALMTALAVALLL